MSTFSNDLIATTQGRLADLGYYTGAIDGVSGPLTEFAMRDFKVEHGLLARPYPGPLTLAHLWDDGARRRPDAKASDKSNDPPWLAEARRLLGTKEAPGKANSPRIMQWARDLDQWYTGDDVPWCGLFVAHCLRVGSPQTPQDFNRLGAREWLKFGVECQASLGAVVVFWRTSPNHWHGHVALVTGVSHDRSAVRVIGGNQSDAVSEAWFTADRVLGYRLPALSDTIPPPSARVGAFSTRES